LGRKDGGHNPMPSRGEGSPSKPNGLLEMIKERRLANEETSERRRNTKVSRGG